MKVVVALKQQPSFDEQKYTDGRTIVLLSWMYALCKAHSTTRALGPDTAMMNSDTHSVDLRLHGVKHCQLLTAVKTKGYLQGSKWLRQHFGSPRNGIRRALLNVRATASLETPFLNIWDRSFVISVFKEFSRFQKLKSDAWAILVWNYNILAWMPKFKITFFSELLLWIISTIICENGRRTEKGMLLV